MTDENTPLKREILFYATPEGTVRVEVVFEDETFWLSQRRMAELFGIGVQTINHHLQEIYKSSELSEIATIRKFRIVQSEVRGKWPTILNSITSMPSLP